MLTSENDTSSSAGGIIRHLLDPPRVHQGTCGCWWPREACKTHKDICPTLPSCTCPLEFVCPAIGRGMGPVDHQSRKSGNSTSDPTECYIWCVLHV